MTTEPNDKAVQPALASALWLEQSLTWHELECGLRNNTGWTQSEESHWQYARNAFIEAVKIRQAARDQTTKGEL